MDYDKTEYEPEDTEFDEEEPEETFGYVTPVKPAPAPVKNENAKPVPRPLSGNPPPSVPQVRQAPAPARKQDRHPILLGIVLVFLLYLFVSGCQGVMNDGKPADTPRYTPRPSYAPRFTPRPTPTPTPTRKVPRSKEGTVHSSGDPYHAEDYVHPDDFYYEYWDDFPDYEEAQDYWEEHH